MDIHELSKNPFVKTFASNVCLSAGSDGEEVC